MRIAGVLVLLMCTASPAAAWPDPEWQIEAEQSKQERYLGREALSMQNGAVWLDRAGFQDGVIEFDLAATADQGFHGLAFRARDRQNYEHVYLRPHMSGNPDATQYTPVFNGVTGWQIYTGPRYSLPVMIVPDRWVHVRIVVQGRRVELSVDGQTLVFPALFREPAPGGIALTSTLAPARFANVRISRDVPAESEGGNGAEPAAVPPGTIMRWSISTPFEETLVSSVAPLEPANFRTLEWATLASGPGGVANLAILRKREPQKNTVFAAVKVRAPEAVSLVARFGFSDRVVVFLNGRPLYRGSDKFRSRDYRFLGTVGLFDEVILPLEKGDNDIWLAVSEDFGGWGVILQLLNPGAVEVVAPTERIATDRRRRKATSSSLLL